MTVCAAAAERQVVFRTVAQSLARRDTENTRLT
jgi:hypothetical protein